MKKMMTAALLLAFMGTATVTMAQRRDKVQPAKAGQNPRAPKKDEKKPDNSPKDKAKVTPAARESATQPEQVDVNVKKDAAKK
jgi:hypothetical protein